ncbi:MAG: hypothetical protein Q8M96_12785, partial [Rubrivivax sp.]|nr:hypothetical protein [Rubrivivax sp.]
SAVACDVLIISGHYDGYNHFFSDQLENPEHLPVDELERVSCSDSCQGLFAQLKEVHLYGCNTLNRAPQNKAGADVLRSLLREGHSLKAAQQLQRSLNAGHGESSHDRMRQVFKDVPVIYGFSSLAPLGPVAAATLGGYFRSHGAREIGRGRASAGLLRQFSPLGMSVAQGMSDQDPHAHVRQDVCRFVDDRLSDADRLGFVHQLLQRPIAQSRVHLDRLERYASTLDETGQHTAQMVLGLDLVAGDTDTRQRFLAFARDADQAEVSARMVKVAQQLGWLTEQERRHELAGLLGQVLQRPTVGTNEINLACTLNASRELDSHFGPGGPTAGPPAGPHSSLPHAAMRACLGSAQSHVHTLAALLSPREADVAVAQDYLRHRPIADAQDLRRLATGISAMAPSSAQVRALETLGRHYVSDRTITNRLLQLFVQTPSPEVQRAVAGVLIRADRRALANPQLRATLVKHRHRSPPGDDMIDALIRRLEAS